LKNFRPQYLPKPPVDATLAALGKSGRDHTQPQASVVRPVRVHGGADPQRRCAQTPQRAGIARRGRGAEMRGEPSCPAVASLCVLAHARASRRSQPPSIHLPGNSKLAHNLEPHRASSLSWYSACAHAQECGAVPQARGRWLPEIEGPAFGKSYSTPMGSTRPAVARIGQLGLASDLSGPRRYPFPSPGYSRAPNSLNASLMRPPRNSRVIATWPTSDDPRLGF
jgi:hypothetical protein